MAESHKLELETFAIEVLLDENGESEVVFSRSGKNVFRASAHDLNTALTFAERHGEITLVAR